MSTYQKPFSDITTKEVVLLLLCSLIYLLTSYFLIGYAHEQIVLVLLINCLYFISDFTRRLLIGFSIFILYWVIYNFMKAFPNFEFNDVTISGIYNLEKSLFGVHENGTILTLNEYWLIHGTTFLDLLCGFFYINWIPVPFLFSLYLFNVNKREFLYFFLTFFLVNLIGFIIYYIVPAAPPWYLQKYGTEFIPLTQSNVAGLIKVDQITGIPIFQSIYSKASNVFAAMPSLHSAYPLVVLFYSVRNKMKNAQILFAILALGIWFAAVYTSHHYLLDVLAGIACAIAGILFFFHVILKIKFLKKFIEKWEHAITKKNDILL
jgi:membrane-associated phospholipid phosphatase